MTSAIQLKESASQTAGPYVHIGLAPNFSGISGVYSADLGATMVNDQTAGERIAITGTIFDGSGAPLRDALIEIWQVDADGAYEGNPHFSGWGRCPSNLETGVYRFDTIKPGRAPFGDGRLMAPHVTLWIAARGINLALQTRLYFDDEPQANAEDPLLAMIEPRERAATLIARRDGQTYTFDIHLQGERETVFLDI